MIEVNLLPTQLVLSPRELLGRRILTGILAAVSVFVVVDLMLFFLFQQLFNRQVADLETARSGLIAQAQQYETITSALQTVEQKTAGIVVVQSFRKDVAVIFAEVVKILVDGVELGNLQVDASGNVSFNAKAVDANALGRFITKVNDPAQKTPLTKIVLSGLRQNEGGDYQFQVSAQYENF